MLEMKRVIYLFAIGICTGLMSFWAMAETKITVIDHLGQPVSNAVVSINTEQSSQPDTTLAVMDQIDFSFVPRVLVIQKGQSVLFPNSDDIRHSVYSFSEAKAFELKLYKGNQTKPLLFDKEGLVVLGCNIHDDMIGYIYVTDDEIARVTNDEGKVTLPLDGLANISIWHERSIQSGSGQSIYSIDSDKGEVELVLELIPSENEFDNKVNEGHTHHSGFNKKF